MSEPKLRWGILGTGAIARCLAENLPKSETGVLVAVGSRTQASADAFAARFGGVTAHASYEALLADANVDAVYLTTPHPMHAEWTIKAVRAGKHVLCEKPFALNAAETAAVLDEAAAAKVTVMEAFMWRCHPQTRELVRLLREKVIGDVTLIRCSFGFKCGFDPKSRIWSAELAGGGIMDVGCYAASAARLVAGVAAGGEIAEPTHVTGVAHLAETGVDAHAIASLKFPGGIVAQLSTSVGFAQEDELRVYGTDGQLCVPTPWVANREKPVQGKIVIEKRGVKQEIDVAADVPTYAMEVDTFAAAVRGGTGQAAFPAMTWADTLGQSVTLDKWRAAVGVTYPMETAAGYPRTTLAGTPLTFGDKIPHGRIAQLDKLVSRLVLGCDNQRSLPARMTIADAFFELGGNAFDTAHVYGGGLMEKLLGHWMKARGVREQCVVIAKGAIAPDCFPATVGRQLAESLERLQTDHADVYMMHRDNTDVPVGEWIDVLNEHVAAGRFRAFGGSNWTVERVQAANDYAARHGKQGFSVLSNNFSLARMIDAPWGGCVAASDDASREWLETSGVALLSWASQAQGFFAPGRADPAKRTEEMLVRSWYSDGNFERKSRAEELARRRGVDVREVPLAYVLNQAFPVFALIGPRRVSELTSSLPAIGLALSQDEIRWLDLRD